MQTERTVLIADDAAGVRAMLEALIEIEPGLRVVATAADGAEAVERCTEHRPDVVLLDVAMPVLDGIGALPLIREASPNSAVVLYTAFDLPAVREQANELGASSVLIKGCRPDAIIESLRSSVPALVR